MLYGPAWGGSGEVGVMEISASVLGGTLSSFASLPREKHHSFLASHCLFLFTLEKTVAGGLLLRYTRR